MVTDISKVMAAQRLLGVKADGIWGPVTAKAFAHADEAAKSRVQALVGQVPTAPRVARADRSAVEAIIRTEAERAGVNADALVTKAKIESSLNPSAFNGSSRGLFAFQPSAWKEAQRVDPRILPYEQYWSDPVQNTRAAIAYKTVLNQHLDSVQYDGPRDEASMYLAHQQGAAGLNELYRASRGLPPSGVQLVRESALIRNPPPDGLGPTSTKADFYARWMAVVSRRFR